MDRDSSSHCLLFSANIFPTRLHNLTLTLDAVVFSRIMGTFALLFSEPLVNNMEHSAISASKRVQNLNNRIDGASNIEINTLSSIMDRLYVWEKRLHKEIMVCYFSLYQVCLNFCRYLNSDIDLLSVYPTR